MLNEKQKQVLIGSLLGHAYVEKNGLNCRVVFEHSMRQ
jgi:hypothetical protein